MSERAYGGNVLEHFRHPRNHGSLTAPDVSEEGVNALCGDRVRIELAIDGDRIDQARFVANACAICVASASMLTVRVTGMSVADAAALTDDHAVAQLGSEIPAARVACAVLPMETLRRGLNKLKA